MNELATLDYDDLIIGDLKKRQFTKKKVYGWFVIYIIHIWRFNKIVDILQLEKFLLL